MTNIPFRTLANTFNIPVTKSPASVEEIPPPPPETPTVEPFTVIPDLLTRIAVALENIAAEMKK